MKFPPWLSIALLACGLALAPAADRPAVDDAHDVVFLGEARPVLIRMHIRVDGKPVRTASDEFMKYLFAYLDVNGDGTLDKDEAARAPTADQILGGVLAGIAGGGGG